MAGRDDAEACGSGVAGRRGLRALRRVARYALVGLAMSVAGVLAAAPFSQEALFPHVWVTQKSARAWVSDSTPYRAGEESFRYVGIEGSYVGSSPDDVAMPQTLESLLLEEKDGKYTVWWSGFPFRSVCGWHVQAGALAGGGPPTDEWHGVVRLPIASPHGVVFLPFRPLWLGFLGNVTAYALGMFLVVECFRRWRRAFLRARGADRRERGQCERCGYELAGLPACPECGRGAEVVAS